MSAAFNPLNSAHNANAKGVNVTVNLNAAPLMAAAAHKGMAVPMSSPIADFSFLSDAFDLSGAGNAAAADAALMADPSTANALNALRRSAAVAQAGAASVLPSPSPPLAMLGMYGDSGLPPLTALAPAAMNAASLMADDVPHNAAAAAAAAALAAAQAAMPAAMAAAHPFALSYSAPGSPSLSLAGDATDPDSPSSIASDLSSASSLLTSAAASPRILASLPRHSSTPSLAALAAATPAFAAASPAAGRAAPALPSLKPSLRQSNSKNNLVYLSAAPKAGVSLNSFSLAAAVNSASASASAAAGDEDEQPSKKKQKANDASMRRVKSSPALADDSDSDASDSDDDAPPAKGAAAAGKAKGRKNPISLVTKDGKPKSEAEIKKEKAERRLAKKAEAARQSRKRKKAYVQQLEEKAAKLEARLAQLEGAAAAGAHAAPAHMRSPAPAAAAAAAAAGAHPPMVPTPSAAAAAMVQATTLHALHREEQSEVLARLSKAVTQFVALATTQPPAVNPNAPGAAQAAAQAAAAAVKEKERLLEDIKALIERYVVNSRKRQQTVTYYLDRLAELMVPDAAVKVALWGLSQPDSYYAVAAAPASAAAAAGDGKQSAAAAAVAQANANIQAGAAVNQAGAINAAGNAAGAGVFSALMAADVGLTTAQLSKLAAEFRGPVSGVMDALKKSAAHVAELREHVKAHMAARNRHIDELRHILNPIQIANYLLWVERNPQLANRLSSSSAKSSAKNQSANANSANNSGAGSASAGSCQTGAAKGHAGGAGADGAAGLGSGPNSPVVVTATAVPYAGVMGLSGLSGFAAYGGGAHGK